MPDTLMETKLHIPRSRPALVPRPRLIERLDAGLDTNITLISAPAGFGKTTLVAEWIGRRREPPTHSDAMWLSLDERDNDPTRFLAYIAAALQKVDPHTREIVESLHIGRQVPAPETVLAALINELSWRADPVLLVLDDFQAITYTAIYTLVTTLVDHMPPQLHLTIITRADPLLPLPRWRARRELTELHADDLRFTLGETAELLTQLSGLHLSSTEIATLDARTEGWIAGLQLAALSMRDRDDVSEFIASFAGSHRYIMDYLVDEVLQQRPTGTEQFLLCTAVLDRLCGSLCDALTGRSDGQATLERLEHANLFIVPLDHERRWYRYHHLFADVLRNRFRQTAPDLIQDLYRRASSWCEQNELVVEAVDYAILAADFAQAAGLIGQHGPTIAFGGQLDTVVTWLDSLPNNVMRLHPAVCVYHAAALMFTNQTERAELRLRDAEHYVHQKGIPPDQSRAISGQVAAIRAGLCRIVGDLEHCIDYAGQALALLPVPEETPLRLRAVAMLDTARAYRLTGDVTAGSENLAMEVIAPIAASGNRFAALESITNLAYLQTLQGRLHQARRTYERAMQMVTEPGELEILYGNASYYVGLGDLFREQNDLETAERYLIQGTALVAGAITVEADIVAQGFCALARLQQARQDTVAANRTLAELSALAQQRGYSSDVIARADAVQAQIALAQDNLAAAVRWADSHNVLNDGTPCYPGEAVHLVLARVRIAQERTAPTGHHLRDILPLLDCLLAAAEAGGRQRSVLEICILRALTHQVQCNLDAALVELTRALTIGEPEGFVRLFVDEGEPMVELLRVAHSQDIATAYVSHLLLAFPDLASKPRDGAGDGQQQVTLVEPLSERELEVLRLLAVGASNRDIAEALVIAVPTVKKHVSNIFGKLGAGNRTQAVALAHEWDLF